MSQRKHSKPDAGYLVTGHRSGLGRHLVSLEGFRAFTTIEAIREQTEPRATVHCGYRVPSHSNVEIAAFEAERQIKRTLEYISKSKGLFVFISSIDVYPVSQPVALSEHSELDLREIKGHHGLLKIYLEHLVKANSDRYCIVRPGLMLGEFARPNTVSRIVRGEAGPYSLSSESRFALVTHNLVAEFVQRVIEFDQGGTWNLASPDTVSLKEVALLSDNSLAHFGTHTYQAPNVDSSKAASFLGKSPASAREILVAMRSNELRG